MWLSGNCTTLRKHLKFLRNLKLYNSLNIKIGARSFHTLDIYYKLPFKNTGLNQYWLLLIKICLCKYVILSSHNFINNLIPRCVIIKSNDVNCINILYFNNNTNITIRLQDDYESVVTKLRTPNMINYIVHHSNDLNFDNILLVSVV